MKTTDRSYIEASDDLALLSHFITDHYAYIRSHSTWCLGRLVDWRYGLWGNKLSTPGFWQQNAHLWFDGFGDLAGFAISEDGGPEFAILTTAGTRFLFEPLLQWVIEHWGDRKPALSIEISALQTYEAGLLGRYGFEHDVSFTSFGYDLTQPPTRRFPLEEGFTIVDMATHPDYRAQHALRQNAFAGRADLTDAEIDEELRRYSYAHESPIYHPETDLCVVAPDGSFVSGCEALIDTRNVEADIERVCTHSDYRRRGFARAVIQACMDRLREMGLRRAYIGGYSPEAIGLYASMGPEAERECLIYRQREV